MASTTNTTDTVTATNINATSTNNSSMNNTIKIVSPTMETIQKELEKQISYGVTSALNEVLTDISTVYKLDMEELRKRYSDKLVMVDNTVIKPKKPRAITSTEQCMARTSGQIQCTRKRQNNSEYCGSHLHKQPHGRIDDPVTTTPEKNDQPTQPKKRGRPKGSTKKKSETDDNKISISEVEIDGTTYIMDDKNNLFEKTSDDNIDPDNMILVGKLNSDDNTCVMFNEKKHAKFNC